ncbi:MAG: AarF/ABC1/UbiB kinase family protein [Proteobacteria bacterium]|nr:AarF/ABC1/UbiB kinase family protein [Pseudomonadota bacterium]
MSKESISMFGVIVHDAQRLATIANVLRKFGFGNLVKAIRSGLGADFQSSNEILQNFKVQPSDMAVNLRAAIEELGTTYIKFGQMLSTRYDLLPRDIIQELAKLQDGSPQMEFETIETILNNAYGDYHEHFQEITREPIGSASIAQAHRALLKDGTPVVLKIQRPGLLPLIRSDIDILNIIAKVLDYNIEEIAYFNLPALIQEFERSIISELNFNHERENIEYFEQKYADLSMFEFPTPNPELSRPNILVMKELTGQKITTIQPDTPQAHDMANAILDIAFDMVFRDGVFHADPHPGNVFATSNGKIGLLDFGLVGRFTPRQRSEFTRIILAVHFGDCAVIARTLLNLGHPTKRVILDDLEAEISAILQKYSQSSLQKIDIAAFAADFVAAGQKFSVQIPSEFTNAVRALINIEGIIQYLNPNLDVIQTLTQFSQKLLADTLRRENAAAQILQAGINLAELGHSLPSHFTQIMQDLEHDGISVNLSPNASNELSDAINGFATRIAISFMILGLTVVIVLFVPQNTLAINIAVLICLLWIVFLCIWHIKARTTHRRIRINPMISQFKRRNQWF